MSKFVNGFGKNSILHTAKILRLSEDLPMVVEIADSLEKVEAFLPTLDEMIKGPCYARKSESHSLQVFKVDITLLREAM